MSWHDVQSAVDQPAGPLWEIGHSSRHGHNDQVRESALVVFTRSLYLIRPEALTIVVAQEQDIYGRSRRRVRAVFTLNDLPYRLAVTDPPVERAYLARPDGQWTVTEALLCVSLAEPFHGYAYKLAASVITRDRAEG